MSYTEKAVNVRVAKKLVGFTLHTLREQPLGVMKSRIIITTKFLAPQ